MHYAELKPAPGGLAFYSDYDRALVAQFKATVPADGRLARLKKALAVRVHRARLAPRGGNEAARLRVPRDRASVSVRHPVNELVATQVDADGRTVGLPQSRRVVPQGGGTAGNCEK